MNDERPLYRDIDGNPITVDEWVAAWEKHRQVGRTDLPDGKLVSTVWLGVDHARAGRPLIFETMVFPDEDDYSELDVARYSTRAEALAGHDAMCNKWIRKIAAARANW